MKSGSTARSAPFLNLRLFLCDISSHDCMLHCTAATSFHERKECSFFLCCCSCVECSCRTKEKQEGKTQHERREARRKRHEGTRTRTRARRHGHAPRTPPYQLVAVRLGSCPVTLAYIFVLFVSKRLGSSANAYEWRPLKDDFVVNTGYANACRSPGRQSPFVQPKLVLTIFRVYACMRIVTTPF